MSTNNHFSGKVALKAIIESESKVLLVRDAREFEEIWEIPGGRMDVGEDPKEALKREIIEELGVECDVHEVVHIQQFWQKSESAQALLITYRAILTDSDATLVLAPEEIAEVKWFARSELTNIKIFKEYEHALAFHFANRTE